MNYTEKAQLKGEFRALNQGFHATFDNAEALPQRAHRAQTAIYLPPCDGRASWVVAAAGQLVDDDKERPAAEP